MSRVRPYLLGLLILGLLGSSVAAQIYRWVDEKGTVHFSDERPRGQSGVKEVVEAGARRTPMVRGGPELRVDTPTPSFGHAGDRDDYYDDGYYDDGPYDDAPRQGDTFIEVYEPPIWFDDEFDDDKRRDHRKSSGRGEGGRHRDGGHDGKRGGKDGWSRGERGRGDRGRDVRPPAVSLPAPAPPRMAPPPGRSSSRARSLAR